MAATRESADRSAPVFAALGDGRRRELMAMLAARPGSTATELAVELPITRQGVLKHLDCLEAACLVAASRDGRAVRYRLTPAPLSEAVAWMTAVGAEWDERLAALSSYVRGRR
jgi:DNA-binding transcriptional ArsR family regulator